MLLFGLRTIEEIIIFAIVIFFAFAYHEFAHAIVADKLGDPTPRSYGRITLNPFPHVQLAGYIMVLLVGVGGAYTPVSPGMLRGNRRRSHALVAVAGPIANVMMAMLFALPFRLVGADILPPMGELMLNFFSWGIMINLLLAVLNMMPVPPLDGFTILLGVLPPEIAYRLEPIRQYGLMIIFLSFLVLPRIGIDIFGAIITPIMDQGFQLLVGM